MHGFSRLLVFLAASNHNRKKTVASHFLAAVLEYGLPSRIRVDHGGENNDVTDIMDVVRGPGRGSSIRGRSVHNQRIERSWRDLWANVSHLYYDLFAFMEDRGVLDAASSLHLKALHLVFLRRINRDLAM